MILLPLYIGIHLDYEWNVFDMTDMTTNIFVLDAIRKPTDIDKMFAGAGLPHVFYPHPNDP